MTYARPFVNFLNQGATVTATYAVQLGAFGAACGIRGTAMSHTPGIVFVFTP